MRTTSSVLLSAALLLNFVSLAAAQSAGREPEQGTPTTGGTTLIDNENRVTSTGVLRLWQAYSEQGGRTLLKVYRPEGSRLVLVGASAMETVPAGAVATFECAIPVSRNDIIGVYCPDAGCVDRFADGKVLSMAGDVGTEATAAFVEGIGTPAVYAGGTPSFDVPSPASTALVLPVAARNPGVNDTMWTTSLEIFNTATEEVQAALFFNRSGEDNTSPAGSARVVLPARTTVVFEDVFTEVFQLEEDAGSIDILASSPLIAHARIANVGSGEGSYGQLVPALPVDWALGDDDAPGVNPNGDIYYLFEVRENEQWRTNLGVVNVSGMTLIVELTAFSGTNVIGEQLEIELPPYSHIQANHVLDLMEVPRGTPRVRVNAAAATGSAGRFFVYASRVDNRTGDAVFLSGAREGSLISYQ